MFGVSAGCYWWRHIEVTRYLRRLKSTVTQSFVRNFAQFNNMDHIQAPHIWSILWESTGHQ